MDEEKKRKRKEWATIRNQMNRELAYIHTHTHILLLLLLLLIAIALHCIAAAKWKRKGEIKKKEKGRRIRHWQQSSKKGEEQQPRSYSDDEASSSSTNNRFSFLLFNGRLAFLAAHSSTRVQGSLILVFNSIATGFITGVVWRLVMRFTDFIHCSCKVQEQVVRFDDVIILIRVIKDLYNQSRKKTASWYSSIKTMDERNDSAVGARVRTYWHGPHRQ